MRQVSQGIDVPEQEVYLAIRKGMIQGKAAKNSYKQRGKTPRWLVPTIVILGFILSFVLPPVSQVLANVPLIGSLYGQFNDWVGYDLETQGLITKVNEISESQGIKVKITEAYYDGGTIGVAFEISGAVHFAKDDQSSFYEIFNGDSNISETQEIVHLTENGTGFSGVIQMASTIEKLEMLTSVPVEFLRIGKTEGSWRFDVPIEHLPYTVHELKVTQELEEEQVQFVFESYFIGKASLAFNYQATYLASDKNNQVLFEVYDDQGKSVHQMSTGIRRGEEERGEFITYYSRGVLLEPIHEKTSYLEFHPKIALTGKDPNKPTPLEPFRIYFAE